MPWEKVAFSREVLWAINAAIDLERTSFKVQLSGGICPHEVGVRSLEILQPEPLGLGLLGWGWEGQQAEPQQQALHTALV